MLFGIFKKCLLRMFLLVGIYEKIEICWIVVEIGLCVVEKKDS